MKALPPLAQILGDQGYPPHPLNPTRPVTNADAFCILEEIERDVITRCLTDRDELCYTFGGQCFMLPANDEKRLQEGPEMVADCRSVFNAQNSLKLFWFFL